MDVFKKIEKMDKNKLLKICKIMNISTNNTMKKKMLIELLLHPLIKSTHSYKMKYLKQPGVFLEGFLPGCVSQSIGLSRDHPSLYCSYVKSKKIGYGTFKKIYDINCDYYCSEKTGECKCKDKIISIIPESFLQKTIYKLPGDEHLDKLTRNYNRLQKHNEYQMKYGGPKIYDSGSCMYKDENGKQLFYNIEEKFTYDLIKYINKNVPKIKNLKNFKAHFKSVLNQVKELHDDGIGHFDIKPENILVNVNDSQITKMVLTDFDFAGKFSDESDFRLGTPIYIDGRYTKDSKRDIFSLGVTLLASLFIPLYDKIDKRFDNLVDPMGNKNFWLIIKVKPNQDPKEWFKRYYFEMMETKYEYGLDTERDASIPLLYGMLNSDLKQRFDINRVIDDPFWKI